MKASKAQILEALARFINARPGFDPNNYSDMPSYRHDMREATRQRRDALTLLRYVELRDSITAEHLRGAFRQRLTMQVIPCSIGGDMQESIPLPPIVEFDYCAGQYYCTEYRAAAAQALASAIWDWQRDNMPDADGYALRAACQREFPRGIARRYFN